jgi:hypothetical protein
MLGDGNGGNVKSQLFKKAHDVGFDILRYIGGADTSPRASCERRITLLRS